MRGLTTLAAALVLALTMPALASSMDFAEKLALHAHQTVITATIVDETLPDGKVLHVMTVLDPPSDPAHAIRLGETISGSAVTGAPRILVPLGPKGENKYLVSASENIPVAAQLTLTLPAKAEKKAEEVLMGNGSDNAGISCQFVAARADRGTTPADTMERQALKEECLARKLPGDWPDKATHHANAVTAHAKALALDPSLPALDKR